MNRIMIMGVVISCLFLFSGCATIMSHGPQTLHILSQPDGATCEITDVTESKIIVKTKTPHTTTLERGNGYFQKKHFDITFSKDGYVTEKVSITPELNPWYFCNLFLGGGIGAILVDPLTGSMWTFYQDSVSVKLYPDTPEGRAARSADEVARLEALAKENEQGWKQTYP
ncbi:MAG: hypothetical protein WBN66_13650 [Smithella sp.]